MCSLRLACMLAASATLVLAAGPAAAAFNELAAPKTAPPPPPPPPAPKPAPPAAVLTAMASADNWRQVLMAPRVTGNLRAVAVDPSDPKHIYVGTEEGTVVHSADGGVTWEESELSPFLLQSRTVRIDMYGDDYKAVDVFAGINVAVGSIYYGYPSAANRRKPGVGVFLVAPPLFDMPPYFINPVRIYGAPDLILRDIGTKDPKSYEPITRVRVCPGGANTVFVTTGQRLHVSPDGVNYVAVFFSREDSQIGDVACSPVNPNEVIVTRPDGVFRSTDGGFSFDPLLGVLGAVGASAVTFGPPDGGFGKLYVGSGRDLWIGDPAQADGMKPVNLGGEFTEIRYIAATSQSVWLATDTGVRVSRDGGTTWTSIDELEGFDWDSVAVTPGPNGVEHVAVLRGDIAFDSIDGGNVFRPFFKAQSRRGLRQLAALPTPHSSAFLLLTTGELWSTVALEPTTADASDEALRRRAVRRLRQMPSLADTLDRARVKTRTSDAIIDDNYDRLRSSSWLPTVRFAISGGTLSDIKIGDKTISAPQGTLVKKAEANIGGEVELIWNFSETVMPSFEYVPVRKDIHQIRKRFLFAIEDAYQERRGVLAQLAAGGLDAEQLLTLQARLEVLDVVLQELSGEPVQK